MDSNTKSTSTEYQPKRRFNADSRQPVNPEDYIAIRHYSGLMTYHPVTSITQRSLPSYNLPTLSSAIAASQSTPSRHTHTCRESYSREQITFRTLFVKNLEKNHTKRDLFTLFGPYGKIITYRIVIDKRARRYGFVTYLNPDSALAALMDLNGRLIGKGRLVVEPALLQWPQNIWHKLPGYKNSH